MHITPLEPPLSATSGAFFITNLCRRYVRLDHRIATLNKGMPRAHMDTCAQAMISVQIWVNTHSITLIYSNWYSSLVGACMRLSLVPSQGDFVIVNFHPHVGHEQNGRRPGLVVSNEIFNRSTGMALMCPLTNTDRGIPFHVKVPRRGTFTGVVMVDQVKSVDYQARDVRFMHTAPDT